MPIFTVYCIMYSYHHRKYVISIKCIVATDDVSNVGLTSRFSFDGCACLHYYDSPPGGGK